MIHQYIQQIQQRIVHMTLAEKCQVVRNFSVSNPIPYLRNSIHMVHQYLQQIPRI